MTPAEYAALNGYQQQQQEESGGLLDFLGKAALAAGVAAGGYAGIRSLRGKGSQLLPKRQVARPQPQGFDAVRRIAAEGAQAKPLVTESALPPAPLTEAQRAAQGVELVRQARAERPQGIQLVNLPEARTVFDPWSGKQTIPDPFGAGTVPSPQITPRTTTTTQLLPAGRITTEELQAANRLLEDTDLLKRVEAEELAVENLLPENRAEQSRQQAQVRRAKSQLAGQVLSETKNQEPQISTQGFLQKQLEQAGYIETSVQKQQADLPIVVDQSVNAVYSAEDQQTGRIKHRLQQNENLDLGQIELLEDMAEADRQEMMRRAEPSEMIGYEADAAINSVASQLPTGKPLDQAEGIDLRTGERFAIKRISGETYPKSTLGATGLVSGQRIQMEKEPSSAAGSSAARFMEAEREKIAREMSARDLAAMPADVEKELARRLGPEAYTYGPKYTARRQALELFAKTGSPQAAEAIKRFGLSPVTFETFENMPVEKRRLFETRPPMSLEGYPSTELQAVVDPTGLEINMPGAGRADVSTLRKPVITEDTALAAEQYIQERKKTALDWLSGIKSEVEPQLNEIFSERRAIIENQAAQLKPLLNQAQATGNKAKTQELEAQLNALRYQFRNPQSHPHRRDESNLLQARIRGAERKIQADIQTYEKKYPTTISDWSGGTGRVFGELDVETGEFIPETMELRADRPAVDIGAKGGGGRNLAEYTAGQRLDEEVRAIQGGGRIRDYDPETGAVASRWAGDETQTGRAVDIYGVRLSGQRPSDPEVRPSVPQYTSQEIEEEALRMSQADPYGDVPVAPAYENVVESLGTQPKTPESRRSLDVALELRRLQTSGRPGEAQAFLDKMMKQRGISGVSGTFSRIR